ncbi:glycosyltransferase [Microbacterium aurum]
MSVVIPCYRYGHYLETSVKSVLNQRGVQVEVIIVDDASGDGSADVARRLASEDDRVRVIAHAVNRGHIATFNEGLDEAVGAYVSLLSADDLLAPGSLSRSVSLMQHHPRVGMVYGHAESFSADLPVIRAKDRSWTVWAGRRWFASMCGRAFNPVYTPGVVMRKEAWQQSGGYDQRTQHAEDMLMWYKTALRWDIGRVNNGVQAFYRLHGANMHLTRFAGALRDLAQKRKVIDILYADAGEHDRPPVEVRERGMRALVRSARRLRAVAARDGAPADVLRKYDDFARETCALHPSASPTRRQAQWDAFIETRAASLVRRVDGHLRWRRWRRYGT